MSYKTAIVDALESEKERSRSGSVGYQIGRPHQYFLGYIPSAAESAVLKP